MEIKTSIDILYDYIKKRSPIKEDEIPIEIKRKVVNFDKVINVLEDNHLLEVNISLFGKREFIAIHNGAKLDKQYLIDALKGVDKTRLM